MKVNKIFSKNADFQRFQVLQSNRNKRYQYNEFLVEGVRCINAAILNNWHISSFLYTEETPLSNWATDLLKNVKTDVNYELSHDLMVELSKKEDTSELMAIVRMREDTLSQIHLSDNPILALFDRPSNKGNLGTMIRSCDALGITGLIITGHAVDLYDPDVISASMGSFFKIPVIRIADVALIENFIQNMKIDYPAFQTIGTTAHKERNLFDVDLTTPLLFMIGNETDGLCNRFKDVCDILTTIPMSMDSSATSLNVACAATVLFYEAVRQRMV
jgi:rRNA methylases